MGQPLKQGQERQNEELRRENEELRENLHQSQREKIFELIDIEIRRCYKKSEKRTTPEKHEFFLKLNQNNYRKDNISLSNVGLFLKYKKLKKSNDERDRYDELYYKNHKFLVIFEDIVENILQGYIVQFFFFLITGESHGRYRGYWDKKPENKSSTDNIEDTGKNHGEKLETNFTLSTNDKNNSHTNTLCFFNPQTKAEKNDVSVLDLPKQKLKNKETMWKSNIIG